MRGFWKPDERPCVSLASESQRRRWAIHRSQGSCLWTFGYEFFHWWFRACGFVCSFCCFFWYFDVRIVLSTFVYKRSYWEVHSAEHPTKATADSQWKLLLHRTITNTLTCRLAVVWNLSKPANQILVRLQLDSGHLRPGVSQTSASYGLIASVY